MSGLYALIMAGGEGTRFYPLSTPEKPKQFLNFIGEKTFLRQTFERAARLCPPGRIYVSTNDRYAGLVSEQIPEIPTSNIIGEPVKKNTGPALVYATSLIAQEDPEAIVACLPSDHHISDDEGFARVISLAADVASKGFLVTVGMTPSWPSPEYGYIKPARPGEWSEVSSFEEKPDVATAKRYMEEGYLWNGGIFVWKTEAFLAEVASCMPSLLVHHDAAGMGPLSGLEARRRYFESAPAISIDYAVMEKSGSVAVVPASVGWSDVGTWESVKRLMEKGVVVSPRVRSVLLGDDVAPWRSIVPKPWGHEELWALGDRYAGKILFIRKGCRLSLQYHQSKEETLRVLSGEMTLELGDAGTRRMSPGDVQHIPPGTRHRMAAATDCVVLEVSTPELDDVVRISDDYGRA